MMQLHNSMILILNALKIIVMGRSYVSEA